MIEKNKDIDIVKLIRDLDWNNELSVQEGGIQDVLSMVKTGLLNVNDLIHATFEKQYWENSARVLLMLPSEYIYGHEELLFDAIQDANWPGTELLVELLSHQSISQIIQLYERAYENAKLANDESWLQSLNLLGKKISLK